jgi:hypothetical protein
MTDLSLAAQAVLDAINKELDEAPWNVSFLAGVSAAAVLRAAAAHLSYQLPFEDLRCIEVPDLLAIAAELEGATQ